jgi:hypothetical protein
MTRRLSLLLTVVLTVGLLPTAAHAAPITFDFEGLPATNNTGSINSLTVTSGGVTMTITRENNDVFDVFQPFGFPASFGNRVISPFLGANGNNAFLINLSQPTFFFGLDFGDIVDDADTLTISAFSGLNQTGLITTQTFPYPGLSFPSVATVSIGGPNPARSLRVIGGSIVMPGTVYLDNIVLDTAAPVPVPEPASLMLLSSALAGAAFSRRRRR